MRGAMWCALGALALMACAEPSAPGPDRGNVGHYTLVSIGGKRLPQPTVFGVWYHAGSVELRADSTVVDVIMLGERERATTVDSVRGTWRVRGDSIAVSPQGWTAYAMQRERDVIRVRWEAVYEYRRDAK